MWWTKTPKSHLAAAFGGWWVVVNARAHAHGRTGHGLWASWASLLVSWYLYYWYLVWHRDIRDTSDIVIAYMYRDTTSRLEVSS